MNSKVFSKVIKILAIFFFLFLFCVTTCAFAAEAVPYGLKWKRQLKGKTYSPLVAKNASLYVGTDEGILYVLKGKDGALKWRYKTGEKFRVAPVVEGGYVFLGAENGSLYVLDAFSGNVIWFYKGSLSFNRFLAGPAYNYVSLPQISGDKVFHAEGGKVNAFNKKTGNLLWTFNTGGNFSSVSASEERVYVASGEGKIYALSVDTGKELWQFKTDFSLDTSPSCSSSKVFQGDASGTIYALDAESGKFLWSFKSEGVSFLKAAKGVLYFCSNNGNLYAFKGATGRILFRFETEGGELSYPTLYEGNVYLSSNDGRLYALDSSSGKLKWAYDTRGFYVSSAAFEGDLGFVVANIKEGKTSNIVVTAFKKSWSPGILVKVGAGKESPVFAQIVNYFVSAAESGKNTPLFSVVKISSLPLKVFVGFLKEFYGGEKEVTLSYLLHHIFASGVLASFVFSSYVLVYFLNSMVILFLIFSSMPFAFRFFGAGFLRKNENNKSLSSSAGLALVLDAIFETSREKRKVYILSVIPLLVFLLFALKSILFTLVLGLDVLTKSYFWICVAIWVSSAIIGSFLKTYMFLLAKDKDRPDIYKCFSQALKKGRELLNLAISSFLLLFLLFIFSALLGLGKTFNSFILLILGAAGLLLLSFLLFADIYIVFERKSVLEAFKGSVLFVYKNFSAFAFYFVFSAVILFVAGFLSSLFSNSFLGFFVFVLIFSLLLSYLLLLHLNFFKLAKK